MTLIREQSFANATPSMVLKMSIVELAEMATASSIYLDGLGWLIGQFWEDKERQVPLDNQPLLDDNGRLWSREDFGDDLTDEEYLVAEKIYHTAEFCSALYHHHPFDLSVLGENSPTGEFEYCNEALCDWIRTAKTRRVAALVCNIVMDAELNKAVRDNQAVRRACVWRSV